MTEPLDTYAAYVARTRAEKLAATKARQMQKVWRAHLKRQYKGLAGTKKGSRALAFSIVYGRVKKLVGGSNNRPAARTSYLLPSSHANRLRFIEVANQRQPLP